jgi:hypothetical protein
MDQNGSCKFLHVGSQKGASSRSSSSSRRSSSSNTEWETVTTKKRRKKKIRDPEQEKEATPKKGVGGAARAAAAASARPSVGRFASALVQFAAMSEMITGGASCNNYTSSPIRTKVAQEAYYGDRKTATWPSMAASARKVKNGLSPDYRWWLADTGCPYDLVSKDTLPPDALGMMGHSKKGMSIDTCNGQVSTNKTICMQVDELKEQNQTLLAGFDP